MGVINIWLKKCHLPDFGECLSWCPAAALAGDTGKMKTPCRSLVLQFSSTKEPVSDSNYRSEITTLPTSISVFINERTRVIFLINNSAKF